MKAIVLAAGRGSRLGKYTEDRPKSLIELGGKTLMQRNLENIKNAGFDQVVVVVGYRHELLEQLISQNFSTDFYRIVMNPDYTRGSGSSLICAAEEIQGDIVIIESDLLYDGEIVQRISSPNIKNAMALGYFNHGRKEVKLYLKNGYIAKAQWSEPEDKEATGDWVGFTKLTSESSAIMQKMLYDAKLETGKEFHYESFIFRLVEQQVFQAIYIQDLPWIEIDNEIDLKRAETEIIPWIERRSQHK